MIRKTRALKYLRIVSVLFFAVLIFLAVYFSEKSYLGYNIISACKDTEYPTTCTEKRLIQVLEKRGTRSVFLTIEKLKTDKDFAPRCHSYAHLMGVAAYPLLLKNKDVFSVPISACEYGYVHGLMMEVLMHGNRSRAENISFARNYCEKLKAYSRGDYGIFEQCYHGVGHGIPFYLLDDYKSEIADMGRREIVDLINKGIELCDTSFIGEPECKRGVFGGVASMFMGDHDIKFDKVGIPDLFYICNLQKFEFRKSCYEMFAPALMFLTGQDVNKAISITKSYITNTTDMGYMAQPLGSSIITSFSSPTLLVVVNLCRKLNGEAVQICLEGYMTSVVDAKVVTDFDRDILSICDSGILNKSEREHCRIGALMQARGLLNTIKFENLCSNLNDRERQTFCKN